jgi:hypothetical protein
MFKDSFNFNLVRLPLRAMGFYLTFWIISMIGSLIFSMPSTIWWTKMWHSSSDETFKYVIIGTHSVCALFSFYLSMTVAKAKTIDKSKLVLLFSLLGALLSAVLASPTTPLVATIFTTMENGQLTFKKNQFFVLLSISIIVAFVYFASYGAFKN